MAIKTISVQGTGIRREALASGAITPGHMVELSAAAADTVLAHNSAGQNCYPAFAVEDDLQGNEIGDAYADGARVQYNIYSPGDVVYALVTNGQAATKGAFAESGGDGGLRDHTPLASNSDGAMDEGGETFYVNRNVGIFLDSVDMSDSSEADPASARVRVLII